MFDRILAVVKTNVATRDDLSDFELGMLYEAGADDIAVQTIDIVLSEWLFLGDDPYFDALLAYLPQSLLKDEDGYDRHFFSDDGSLEKNFYEVKWDHFVQDVRHTHRFFNSNAKEFLDSVFRLLSDDTGSLKPGVVRQISRGDSLFRARTVADITAAKLVRKSPHLELGVPPKDRASNQRMTPNGIPALYFSLERNTCLSEIRSITGDVVVSCAMTPVKSLNLLDLTRLDVVDPPRLTIFDDGFRDGLHLKAFLKSLIKKMSKPKGRSDDLSYLSTQVVFEYLRIVYRGQVDGLVFPSVQTGERGTNVVLFPEACVISESMYITPDDFEQVLGPDPLATPTPFGEPDRLAVVAGSLRYHRITGIQTMDEEHENVHELFMDGLTRKRLGL